MKAANTAPRIRIANSSPTTYQPPKPMQTMKTPENTFIIIRIETGEAVAELPDKLAANVNRSKYALQRPSEYLPTLNQVKP